MFLRVICRGIDSTEFRVSVTDQALPDFSQATGEVRDKNPVIFPGVCGQLEIPQEFESAFVYGSFAN